MKLKFRKLDITYPGSAEDRAVLEAWGGHAKSAPASGRVNHPDSSYVAWIAKVELRDGTCEVVATVQVERRGWSTGDDRWVVRWFDSEGGRRTSYTDTFGEAKDLIESNLITAIMSFYPVPVGTFKN